MSTSTRHKNTSKNENARERDDKKRSPSPARHAKASPRASELSDVMEELKSLRRENQEGHKQTKISLTKLETSVEDLKCQMNGLESRIGETEERIGVAEETVMRHERALRYLLEREADLTEKCEDLQNRLRRNNLRIYQIPEGCEEENTMGFVIGLLTTVLQLPQDMEIKIERAHRALAAKPKDTAAPPRSIIVRFLDYAVKDAILRQAWSQKQVLYNAKRIYFDNDYSPELQRKRAQVRDIMKQLKTKNVRAQCVYPAQIKIYLEAGVKTFPTLMDATLPLRELGIKVRVNERDRQTREISKARWSVQGKGGRGLGTASLSDSDLQVFLQKD